MIDLQTPKVFSLEIEKIAKEKEITTHGRSITILQRQQYRTRKSI